MVNGVSQAEAAQRWAALAKDRGIWVSGRRIIHITGKRRAEAFVGCHASDLVVANAVLQHTGPCAILGPDRLRSSGSIAMTQNGILISANELAGDRPWSRH